MSSELQARVQELREQLRQIVGVRYPGDLAEAEIEEQALQAGDCEYLLVACRLARAEREQATQELPWLSPERQADPRESLRRIREICQQSPDAYSAIQAVLVTHPDVPRGNLVPAIKRFRSDLAQLSLEDLAGLVTAAWNGGQQGFEAVLRTRKSSPRVAAPSLWAKHDE
ncbi:hypothetical protein [Pelomonas sp. SE-A7]|uniref:hypothetical protein n=1 Tax=Pelomonas sp. SE-A7 TaxID=3054953 RepID=UPI00259CE704|nr:hypothetical protein [Pelomonas sp. SE-A7]MDM4764762.1 hypothetical protein [Pelomonas sp. SE-A7]